MKYVILSLLMILAYFDMEAQREFTWSDQTTLKKVRPRSVELIRVKGDSAAISTQLKAFYENDFKWINHVIVECTDITSVPLEAYKFKHLFKLEFDNCPNINFRSVIKNVKEHEEDIYAIGFRNMDFKDRVITNEDALRYLEMFSFVNVKNLNIKMLFEALNFNKSPRFSNMGYLHFESCEIDTLDMSIVHLHNLRSLSLPRNKLKYLPAKLPGKLKNLDISFNKFERLPIRAIKNLKKLEFLNLECNKLKKEEILGLLREERFLEDKDPDQLTSLKFACNESIDFYTLVEVSEKLESAAYYRTAASVYENDYKPAQPDCTSCNKFQYKEIKDELYGNWQLIKDKDAQGGVFQGQFDMAFDEEFVQINTIDASFNGRYPYEINKFVEEDFFRISLIGLSRELLIKIDDEHLKAFIPMSGELVLFTFERR